MTEIKKYIETGIKDNVFTSANIRVVKSGDVVLENAQGTYNPNLSEAQTKIDTIYDLASLTKVYVATAFMKFVEDGLAQLDQPVAEVVPTFSHDLKNQITFRQLLSHSSGLPSSFNLYEKGEWNKGKDIVIKKLVSTELVYQPGTQVIYSCLGFMLLGYAMEKMSGEGLDQILDHIIFKPLNMKDIGYKPDIKLQNRISITTDERPNRGKLNLGTVHDGNAIAMDGGISGNAGLFGTAKSVSELGETFYDRNFLKEKTIKEMTKLQAQYEDKRRGLGWQLHSQSNLNSARVFSETSYGHTGFTGTSLWIDSENELVVTLLTNSVRFYKKDGDIQKFNNFRHGLYKEILGLITKTC